MIWGKSDDDKKALENWHVWFAWRPVHMVNEKWVWLQFIYRQVDYGSKGTYRYYSETKEEN